MLAWDPGAQLQVDVDTPAQRVGDTLLVLPAQVRITGPTVFTSGLMQHSILASQANDASDQGSNLALSQGTMNVEYRPIGFSGAFETTSLTLMLTQGEMGMVDDGAPLQPLPAAQQPDQANPVGTSTGNRAAVASRAPTPATRQRPLRRRTAGRCRRCTRCGPCHRQGRVRRPARPPAARPRRRQMGGVPALPDADRVTIPDAARYVDASGSFVVRFVNRAADGNEVGFTLVSRLEGTVK